jgi:hypothetical protein
MSKVMTFSRVFPAYHPKKGQPTYFPEKLWKSLWEMDLFYDVPRYGDIYTENFGINYSSDDDNIHNHAPKYHTIRSGNRWKAGDWFSPRVWSGKPYYSPQITIAPDIQVKKTFDISIAKDGDYLGIMIDSCLFYEENAQFVTQHEALETLAKNDGLAVKELKDWFLLSPAFKKNQSFEGQIICWNDQISY